MAYEKNSKEINELHGLPLGRLAVFLVCDIHGVPVRTPTTAPCWIWASSCVPLSLRVENGRFYSEKQKDREGVGLASVQASASRYGGRADFYKDDNNRFHSEVLMPIRNEESETDQNGEGDA